MANFPTLQDSGAALIQGRARQRNFSGIDLKRATSGKPRLRTTFSQDWIELEVTYNSVDADDTAIMNHYDAHKRVSFTFNYALTNTNYTMQYANEPEEQPEQGEYKSVIVKFIQVA